MSILGESLLATPLQAGEESMGPPAGRAWAGCLQDRETFAHLISDDSFGFVSLFPMLFFRVGRQVLSEIEHFLKRSGFEPHYPSSSDRVEPIAAANAGWNPQSELGVWMVPDGHYLFATPTTTGWVASAGTMRRPGRIRAGM